MFVGSFETTTIAASLRRRLSIHRGPNFLIWFWFRVRSVQYCRVRILSTLGFASECSARNSDDFAIWAYCLRLIHSRKLAIGFRDSKWWVHVVASVLVDNFIYQF